MKSNLNVFVTSQMRCGSTWLCDLLGEVLGTNWVFWEKGAYIKPERFKAKINNVSGITVIKTHYALPETICSQIPKGNTNNFVVSITRDIKDIIVSKIFYIRNDTNLPDIPRLKHLNDIRNNFGNKQKSDREYVNSFVKTNHLNHIIKSWKSYNNGYEHPNYIMISYEDLWNRSLYTIKKITNLLGVSHITNKGLRQILHNNHFARITGRKRGDGRNNAFRRKGIVGDWKNYLSKESVDIIEKKLKSLEPRGSEYE